MYRVQAASLDEIRFLERLSCSPPDLKAIDQSPGEAAALSALNDLAQTWDEKYPQISQSWLNNRENPNTLFNYPADIRKAIYTTNAIESLNSVIRKATKKWSYL